MSAFVFKAFLKAENMLKKRLIRFFFSVNGIISTPFSFAFFGAFATK
jgi:hypothetical protein